MGIVTEIQLANALKEDRHYFMNELQKSILPIDDKMDDIIQRQIKNEGYIKHIEKQFDSHVSDERVSQSVFFWKIIISTYLLIILLSILTGFILFYVVSDLKYDIQNQTYLINDLQDNFNKL